MTTVAIKSRQTNFLEGTFLIAALQGMPSMTAATMITKLLHPASVAGYLGGPTMFVLTTTILYAMTMAWLGPKYPGFFKTGFAPVFFDASLSLKDKVTQWMSLASTQQQLLSTLIMLSLLGVAMATFG